MDLLLAFILGVWIGAVLGVFLHALLVAASVRDEDVTDVTGEESWPDEECWR